jgi:hypothetical protein
MMDGENFSADSSVSRAFITDDPEGKVFPCGCAVAAREKKRSVRKNGACR